MEKSPYHYNTQYEMLLGRWGLSSEQNLLGNLYNAENGLWANEKPSDYLKRIQPELITIVNGLDHPDVSALIRGELLLSIRSITNYKGVCTLLDKISFLTDEDEEGLS